jgi:ketosteroid isomerase-like protein
MSEENVEAWRRAVDAYNRGDTEGAVEFYDPEVEWRPAVQRLLGGEQPSTAAATASGSSCRTLTRPLSEIRIEIAEARDLGDRALFLGRFHGRGKESGAETRSPIAYLVDFRNGKVTRVVSYLDHQEALEAAGLRE